MKFNIISPTRLQVDVYDVNLQLNFEALFLFHKAVITINFFTKRHYSLIFFKVGR